MNWWPQTREHNCTSVWNYKLFCFSIIMPLWLFHDHFNFHSLLKQLCGWFQIQSRARFLNLPLITCHCSRTMIAKNDSLFTMYMKSISNINLNQKLYFISLFKRFIACTGWRIQEHHRNCIFHCHLIQIDESFQDTI